MFSWLSLHGQKGEFHWSTPLKDQSGLYVTHDEKEFDTPALGDIMAQAMACSY